MSTSWYGWDEKPRKESDGMSEYYTATFVNGEITLHKNEIKGLFIYYYYGRRPNVVNELKEIMWSQRKREFGALKKLSSFNKPEDVKILWEGRYVPRKK